MIWLFPPDYACILMNTKVCWHTRLAFGPLAPFGPLVTMMMGKISTCCFVPYLSKFFPSSSWTHQLVVGHRELLFCLQDTKQVSHEPPSLGTRQQICPERSSRATVYTMHAGSSRGMQVRLFLVITVHWSLCPSTWIVIHYLCANGTPWNHITQAGKL